MLKIEKVTYIYYEFDYFSIFAFVLLFPIEGVTYMY
jgi:hypothetical protein